MTVQVTGKNLDVGEALREYVIDRVTNTVTKFVDRSHAAHVRVEKMGHRFRTDCSIQLHSGLSLQSHGETDDAYTSADAALDRLETRLRALQTPPEESSRPPRRALLRDAGLGTMS